MRRIRLSGLLRLDTPLEDCKHLKHLTIHGVTGSQFDVRPLTGMDSIGLESFQYNQGSNLGFEISGRLVSSMLAGSHRSLKKLVLLQSVKLSATELTACLRSLLSLEYFSLSLITNTVNPLDANLVSAVPVTTRILKLKILHQLFSNPFYEEEQAICESLKRRLAAPPDGKLEIVYLHLPHVIGRYSTQWEWEAMGSDCGVQLYLEDWEPSEII